MRCPRTGKQCPIANRTRLTRMVPTTGLPLKNTNVDHHVMHNPKNHQLLIKKKYCLISFVVTNSKILIIINNYASYNMRFFGARNLVYKL